MYNNILFYLSDFDLSSYSTRRLLATLTNLSEFRQMQDTSTQNEISYKYGYNKAQYRPVLSQIVGTEQGVLYTPDLQKSYMNKSNFTSDSASTRGSFKMYEPVSLSGTPKSQTNMDPDVIAPFRRPSSEGKSPTALADLKVLSQTQAVLKAQKKNQPQPTRYSPYQHTYKNNRFSTPKDRNRRHIFKQQCRRYTSLPSDTLEMIPQSGCLPLPEGLPKSKYSLTPYNMSTPLRRPFKQPDSLPYSQSTLQNMTSEADAEAVSLLLILSQAKNIEQRQITPQHETMPAFTKNTFWPEITFQEQIMPELKTTDQTQGDIAQSPNLPLMKSLDCFLMMQNQDLSFQQPETMEEKVDLIISEACRKINIGATSQTLIHLNEEFDKLLIRLKTKGFNIENPKNNHKEITNSHETATIPDVEHTEARESKGNIKKEVFGEHNYYKFTRQLKTYNQHQKTSINDEKVPIGLGYASVPAKLLKNMNWTSYTNCTRKLMSAVFSRGVLATHSLTGKASPAFPGKPAKKMLDQMLINDIVQTIMDKCGVTESQIRVCITTKCADESKMLRMREGKNYEKRTKKYKENDPPSSDSEDDNNHGT